MFWILLARWAATKRPANTILDGRYLPHRRAGFCVFRHGDGSQCLTLLRSNRNRRFCQSVLLGADGLCRVEPPKVVAASSGWPAWTASMRLAEPLAARNSLRHVRRLTPYMPRQPRVYTAILFGPVCADDAGKRRVLRN